jgi:hypothetical protein
MRRRIGAFACLMVLCSTAGQAAPGDAQRAQSMQFSLRLEGPASACGQACRVLVAASGTIRPETAAEFESFAAKSDIRGATIVLESEGGSVLGALALGRAIRKLEMTTAVGRVQDLPGRDRRAGIVPRADCESMCAFVLLAGKTRIVPPEARVRVHQIWLGDRREDATAASYSAEDLVLVQRDIGKLAQYTADMGGAVEMLELSLRIPPWEPMRLLTREELRRMGFNAPAADAADVQVQPAQPSESRSTGGAPRKISAGGERGWSAIERAGQTLLARAHPLTVEGEEIGHMDMQFACGTTPGEYRVSYRETRRAADGEDAPPALKSVELRIGTKAATLAVEASMLAAQRNVRESAASGTIPAAVMKAFAEGEARYLTVTAAAGAPTAIRIGNSGIAATFLRLVKSCAQTREATLRSD